METPALIDDNASSALFVSKRSAQVLFLLAIVLIGWSGLGTLLLAVLFSYFALDNLKWLNRRWATVAIFVVMVSVICFALVLVVNHAIKTLPQALIVAVPKMTAFAEKHGWNLPFSDWDGLKAFVSESIRGEMRYIGDFTRLAAKQFAFLVIGIVIGISIFLNPATDLNRDGYRIKTNLYTVYSEFIAGCFQSFYRSFKLVMQAQLLISAINTALTATFLILAHMPNTTTLIAITFLCGLLPIVGNLLSNSAIVAVGFTVSPELGVTSLIFLIVLHKLEYFLNSKIIGDRIKNPVWLTLIGLIIGEKLMGLTGMVLAPVVLHYLKHEASQVAVIDATTSSSKRS